MPACVPPTKLAKHTTAGKVQSPCKSAKSSDTAVGKAGSPCTTKLAKSFEQVRHHLVLKMQFLEN